MFIKNNRRNYLLAICLICAGIVICLASCSEWDDHFDSKQNAGKQNLMQLLDANPATSKFASMARQAGYAATLSSSQTYTVFAPVDDALSTFDASNPDSVAQLVRNHIARYTQPTSTPADSAVRMINSKRYHFQPGQSFVGIPFSSVANVKATNGLLHEMSGRLPNLSNVYEFMQRDNRYSSIYSFIHSFDETKFDREASTEVDIDANGRPVYDSVWVSYNRLLDDPNYGIGQIENEDSAYTMLIPDNDAWAEAYARISPSFKVYSANQAYADSVQDIRTRLAIVSDLVSRTVTPSPVSLDSLVTTTGSTVKSLSDMFGASTATTASNGYVFAASRLGYDNRETWDKPISVEAEEQNGRSYNNTLTSVYTRNAVATSPIQDISGGAYIEVQPISPSANPALTFDIAGVLAGKYDVYAIFLPASASGEDVTPDSTRISFSLQYLNATGLTQTSNNRSTTDKGLLTSSNGITVMKAFAGIDIPVSDTTDRLWLMEEGNDASTLTPTTHLTVQSNVTAREFSRGTYSRAFRLDRILFVPVKK